MKLKSQNSEKMKTTTTLLAAILLTVSTAFANGNEAKKASQIALYEVTDHQFRLIYPFAEKETVKIEIKDESGKTLTKDRVYNQKGFLRKYDMNALADGNYTMSIETNSETIEKEFTVVTKQQMAANHLGNKRVQVIYTENSSAGTLKIYNKKMELIHKEDCPDNGGFSRVYDLSAFDCNEFTFQLGDSSIALAVNN